MLILFSDYLLLTVYFCMHSRSFICCVCYIDQSGGMQTFKEIPFQNYIELKFNPRNLNDLAQNEALIKYKRNAQLLAQIFTLQTKQRQLNPSQDSLSQEQIDQIAQSIQAEQAANLAKIQRTKQLTKKYEEVNSAIKDIKNKEELFAMIDKLKAHKLYDDSHPYFVQDSPFYLSTSEEECLQVPKTADFSQQGLSFYEIN